MDKPPFPLFPPTQLTAHHLLSHGFHHVLTNISSSPQTLEDVVSHITSEHPATHNYPLLSIIQQTPLPSPLKYPKHLTNHPSPHTLTRPSSRTFIKPIPSLPHTLLFSMHESLYLWNYYLPSPPQTLLSFNEQMPQHPKGPLINAHIFNPSPYISSPTVEHMLLCAFSDHLCLYALESTDTSDAAHFYETNGLHTSNAKYTKPSTAAHYTQKYKSALQPSPSPAHIPIWKATPLDGYTTSTASTFASLPLPITVDNNHFDIITSNSKGQIFMATSNAANTSSFKGGELYQFVYSSKKSLFAGKCYVKKLQLKNNNQSIWSVYTKHNTNYKVIKCFPEKFIATLDTDDTIIVYTTDIQNATNQRSALPYLCSTSKSSSMNCFNHHASTSSSAEVELNDMLMKCGDMQNERDAMKRVLSIMMENDEVELPQMSRDASSSSSSSSSFSKLFTWLLSSKQRTSIDDVHQNSHQLYSKLESNEIDKLEYIFQMTRHQLWQLCKALNYKLSHEIVDIFTSFTLANELSLTIVLENGDRLHLKIRQKSEHQLLGEQLKEVRPTQIGGGGSTGERQLLWLSESPYFKVHTSYEAQLQSIVTGDVRTLQSTDISPSCPTMDTSNDCSIVCYYSQGVSIYSRNTPSLPQTSSEFSSSSSHTAYFYCTLRPPNPPHSTIYPLTLSSRILLIDELPYVAAPTKVEDEPSLWEPRRLYALLTEKDVCIVQLQLPIHPTLDTSSFWNVVVPFCSSQFNEKEKNSLYPRLCADGASVFSLDEEQKLLKNSCDDSHREKVMDNNPLYGMQLSPWVIGFAAYLTIALSPLGNAPILTAVHSASHTPLDHMAYPRRFMGLSTSSYMLNITWSDSILEAIKYRLQNAMSFIATTGNNPSITHYLTTANPLPILSSTSSTKQRLLQTLQSTKKSWILSIQQHCIELLLIALRYISQIIQLLQLIRTLPNQQQQQLWTRYLPPYYTTALLTLPLTHYLNTQHTLPIFSTLSQSLLFIDTHPLNTNSLTQRLFKSCTWFLTSLPPDHLFLHYRLHHYTLTSLSFNDLCSFLFKLYESFPVEFQSQLRFSCIRQLLLHNLDSLPDVITLINHQYEASITSGYSNSMQHTTKDEGFPTFFVRALHSVANETTWNALLLRFFLPPHSFNHSDLQQQLHNNSSYHKDAPFWKMHKGLQYAMLDEVYKCDSKDDGYTQENVCSKYGIYGPEVDCGRAEVIENFSTPTPLTSDDLLQLYLQKSFVSHGSYIHGDSLGRLFKKRGQWIRMASVYWKLTYLPHGVGEGGLSSLPAVCRKQCLEWVCKGIVTFTTAYITQYLKKEQKLKKFEDILGWKEEWLSSDKIWMETVDFKNEILLEHSLTTLFPGVCDARTLEECQTLEIKLSLILTNLIKLRQVMQHVQLPLVDYMSSLDSLDSSITDYMNIPMSLPDIIRICTSPAIEAYPVALRAVIVDYNLTNTCNQREQEQFTEWTSHYIAALHGCCFSATQTASYDKLKSKYLGDVTPSGSSRCYVSLFYYIFQWAFAPVLTLPRFHGYMEVVGVMEASICAISRHETVPMILMARDWLNTTCGVELELILQYYLHELMGEVNLSKTCDAYNSAIFYCYNTIPEKVGGRSMKRSNPRNRGAPIQYEPLLKRQLEDVVEQDGDVNAVIEMLNNVKRKEGSELHHQEGVGLLVARPIERLTEGDLMCHYRLVVLELLEWWTTDGMNDLRRKTSLEKSLQMNFLLPFLEPLCSSGGGEEEDQEEVEPMSTQQQTASRGGITPQMQWMAAALMKRIKHIFK